MTTDLVDLTDCDREPIHIPGSIQSYGVLLVCGQGALRILHVSANTPSLLEQAPEALIGRELGAVLGAKLVVALASTLDRTLPSKAARVHDLELGTGRRVHATLVSHAGRVMIELEPAEGEPTALLPLASAVISRLQEGRTVGTLCDIASSQLRTVIGYDRVMIYRFLHDGSGEVIAEAKKATLEPFLGLRYPASDIPQQARALYLRNWIRLIADVGSQPVPIIPARDASGQQVDLSFVGLRSVSPVHIEYLGNMGVAASMSISIIVAGKLWGLIACHNGTPKVIPADIRGAVELIGQVFSLQIECLEPRDRSDRVIEARSSIDGLLSQFPTFGLARDNISARLTDLARVLPCDGIGLWMRDSWHAHGTTPPADAVPPLVRFLTAANGTDIFATSELSSRLPASTRYATEVSGLMAIPLSRPPRDFLLFFRKEVAHTVKWAGNPVKPVPAGQQGDRLTPRKSFDAWSSEVRGQSQPWEESDRLIAGTLRVALLDVALRLSEVAERERAQAAERQRLLIAELNHRVKNILALINALVTRSQDCSDTLGSFVKGLSERIKALAFAHDQVMQSGSGQIGHLIEAEIAPYRKTITSAVNLDGPVVAVDPIALSALSLVLHEMVSNAAKYGALSISSGKLAVRWNVDDIGRCVIEWEEIGGPAVQAVSRVGFGTTLIDRLIPFELNGESEVLCDVSGVRARFVIPAKHVVDVATSPQYQRPATVPVHPKIASLADLSILLLEDNLLIALGAETMLHEAGAASVEVFGMVEPALAFIAKSRCDAAVLDINLGRETSFPVAEALEARNIPFVFATGYSDKAAIPKCFADVPIVSKPYSVQSLSSTLLAVLVASAKV